MLPITVTRALNLRSWSSFQAALQAIEHERLVDGGRSLNRPLFRGQASDQWKLATTLERSYSYECNREAMSFLEYYAAASKAKPFIETVSGKKRVAIPDFATFKDAINSFSENWSGTGWLNMFMFKHTPVWEYFVYPRHHGFPSPLLDWTTSPYIAAFFAFDPPPPPKTRRVCIYVLLRDHARVVSLNQHLFVIGPYMHSHSRHFQQKCQYTMCVGCDSVNGDYVFRSHESGLQDALGNHGKLIAITIPISERVTALRHLDTMNINAFSLFGSEDTLIRTIARRELLIGG